VVFGARSSTGEIRKWRAKGVLLAQLRDMHAIDRRTFLISIAGALVANGVASAKSGPSVIMLIRHGEDEGQRDYHLSQRGQQRSEALPKLFGSRLPKPDVIIASRATKGSNRPVETVEPLARALGLSIDHQFRDDDFRALAERLLLDGRYDGKAVLVCWHHGKLPKFAKALGVKNAPAWPDDQFDRVWVIEPTKQSARFEDVHQKLLDGDR
jgi:phosphohistidine phosphatase SixA